MSFTEFFSIMKDIFLAGAATITAYVALKGLEKWKDELSGKANFEVARDFIRTVYKLRDEIHYCRSPFISAAEFPEGYNGALGGITNEEKGDAYFYVYKTRWQPVSEAVQNFDTAVLEAEALWGKEVKEAGEKLRNLVIRLRFSLDTFIQNEYSRNQDFTDRELDAKIRADVNRSRSERDTLSPAIDEVIKEIEELVRPHLKRN